MSGAPARGTAPRIPRRHHHHHHHHHHHQNNPPQVQDRRRKPSEKDVSSIEESSRPKVNPIFLWALQREQRIIEVRCEDYDKRNRIKLTKTAQGWRSIPRTASNVYTTSLLASRNLNNNCESPAALSSAASSPSSSRWSPSTISSSTNAPWSVSSSRSLAISSPTAEVEEIPSRNHSEEESPNDFEDSRSSSRKNSRKKRRRERVGSESEKRRKAGRSSAVNSDVLTDEESTSGPLDAEDNSCTSERKKRRRMKKSRERSRATAVASSPRSWELLMNGTRFLNRGPAVDRREDEEENYEISVPKSQGSHFGSIDLERAKRDQHLQPRVVLEQLHLSRPSNTAGITYEAELEKDQESEEDEEEEADEEEEDQIEEEIVESREEPIPEKPEIRDILSMLDSTGSPVLATDTPSAHLPSSHDSTKTNISSCYESRDCQSSSSRQATCREETEREKANDRISQNSCKSNVKNSKLSSQEPRTLVSPAATKIHRRENISSEPISNDLGSSSEILEALRSTPGLSVSVTTRLPVETRVEIPESSGTTRTATKRQSSSALYLERLLPGTPAIVNSPCCSSSEVTCSEDARNELTLKGILATPSRGGHVSGTGLAAVVSRLANRRNDLLRPEARNQIDDPNRTNRKESSSSSTSGLVLENGNLPHKRSRTNEAVRSRTEPAKQLRELVGTSGDSIPDPLLVPRDRLPALAAAPATEIPKLLASRPELRLPEALTRPDLLRDPDLLVISLAHLQHVLDNGEGPVSDYTYRPPHPLAMPTADAEDEEDVDEEDELVEEEEEEDDDEDEDDDEEEEDQDVPEQSLDLVRSANAVNGPRGNVRNAGEDNSMRIQRVPPKLISCKPIGTLMPGPIDLSRSCIRSIIPSRANQALVGNIPGARQQDLTLAQLPPPPLLRVRTGLLKQESEVTSTEVSNNPCVQDDSHLWHPLFGSQKRQRQAQAQQQQQQQQQQHRTSWHRTTLAS